MRRRTKVLLAVVGLLVAAVIVLAILLSTGAFTKGLRGSIAKQITAATSRPTSIGNVAVSLRGRAVLRDVVLRYDDGTPLATIPEATVSLGPGGLHEGIAQLRDLTVRSPTIRLVRDKQGKWPTFATAPPPAKGPIRLPGRVEISNGTLTIVDEQRRSTTTLRDLNVTAASPQAGQVQFSLQAVGEKGAFAQLKAQGNYLEKERRTEVTVNATEVSIPFAVSVLPRVRGITATGGRADIEGTVTIVTSSGKQPVVITPDLTIRPREATVSFPWLHQPLRGVSGTIRVADRDVTIVSATARVAGAPVSASGTVAGLPRPRLALSFAVTNIEISQLRALFPSVTLPADFTVRSPMQVTARAEGLASNVTISGRARIADLVLARIPWRDMVASFVYTRGELNVTDIRAHGSARQLEADIHVRLAPGPAQARATVVMRDLPLKLVSDCFPQIPAVDLSGTADVSLQVATEKGITASGSFTARDVAYRGYGIGRVTGDFTTSGTTVEVARGAVAGAIATGAFSGTVSRAGEFALAADLSALDLSKLGVPAPAGPASGRVNLTGSLRPQRASGRVELGFAAGERAPVRRLGADVALTARELALSNVVMQAAQGEAKGSLTVANWRDGGAAQLDGRFELSGVPVEDWLPPEYLAALPPTLATGTVEVGGSIADPRFIVDLRLAAPPSAPLPGVEVGRVQVAYEHGELQIRDVQIAAEHVRLGLSGTFSPSAGLNLHATGVTVDLAALSAYAPRVPGLRFTGTERSLGLKMSGTVIGDVTATGPLANPHITFQVVSADDIMVNDAPFREVLVSGEVRDGVLTLEAASVRQEDGTFTASGSVNLLTSQLHLTVILTDINVFNAMLVADQAVWRRYHLTGRKPATTTYTAIPRPLGGRLTATVRISGPARGPEVEVASVLVNGFSFRDREIAQIKGSLTLAITPTGVRSVTIPGIEATAQQSVARLRGSVVVGGAIDLNADVNTLDLRLLEPWLPGMISGLGGSASVNVEVTGMTSDPRIRGDVFVDKFSWQGLPLERAEFSPITWEKNQIVISGITLRNGLMSATGAVRLILEAALGHGPQLKMMSQKGELHIVNGRFAPLRGMQPAIFDADLELEGQTLFVQRLSAQGPLAVTPGLVGSLGGGPLTVTGTIIFPSFALTELRAAQYDLTIDLGAEGKPVGVDIEEFMSVKAAGRLRMVNGTLKVDDHTFTGPILQTEEGRPLIVHDGWVTVPPPGLRAMGQSLPLAATPLTNVWLLAGENLRFEYGVVHANAIAGGPPAAPSTGFLQALGPLTAEGIHLEGNFESAGGDLKFPTGTLTLEYARADLTKRVGQLPQITIDARASGTIGDYLVTLNPVGRVYPPPGRAEAALPLGIRTIPSLSEPLAAALLVGSVVVPGEVATAAPLEQLLVSPSLAGPPAGTIAGLSFPALGLPGISIDYLFEGPLAFRFRQRLLGRLFGSYVSPLTGPPETRRLVLTYQVTPAYSFGWSVNGLNQARWQVQSFVSF